MESASPPAPPAAAEQAAAKPSPLNRLYTKGSSGKIRTGGTFQIYLIRTDHSQTLRCDVPFKVAELYGDECGDVRARVHAELDRLLDAACMR